jgi:hypothetical protein
MPLTFYPYSEDAQKGSFTERIDILMEAAERYKAIILDTSIKKPEGTEGGATKRTVPRDQTTAYNWEEIAQVLREIRELPEVSKGDKVKKGDLLAKLAEVYEVLRAAKMSKLEAVRLALISEANQLRSAGSQPG